MQALSIDLKDSTMLMHRSSSNYTVKGYLKGWVTASIKLAKVSTAQALNINTCWMIQHGSFLR